MRTIADLIGLRVQPEDQEHRAARVHPMTAPLVYPEDAQASRKFEFDVFNLLWAQRKALGIQTLFKFENLFIDGALLLDDGRTRLAIEMKLRMNWHKACQSGWQFRQFLSRTEEAKSHPPYGAIVFFGEFEGDGWQRRAQCRLLPDGWNHWYLYHSLVEGRRVDLFRVSGSEIEYYEAALAASKSRQESPSAVDVLGKRVRNRDSVNY